MAGFTNSVAAFALAASALGAVAPAAAQNSPAQDRAAAAAAATDCDTLASNKNLSEFPAANAAFVRNNQIGCKFIIDGDGRHALAQTFDVATKDRAGRSMGEMQYGQQLQTASRQQDQADRRADAQAQRDAVNNNPVRQIQRQTQDAANTVNQIKNLGNVLKGFKF
jgi:hypothetical protein